MSWSDSMASSMTVSGSRSVAARPPGEGGLGGSSNSRLARPARREQMLRRLVQELNASRIIEEEGNESPSLDEEAGASRDLERTWIALNGGGGNQVTRNELASHALISGPAPSAPASQSTASVSRKTRVLRAAGSKVRRLLYLIAYYLRRAVDEYSAGASVYSPLQYRMY
ncbi:hypothetical protein GGF46_002252 [Coemansia sp. RSA 552]|nr:hypothetical protein GGF46_002252 [Coemansia sp. RSA 552]